MRFFLKAFEFYIHSSIHVAFAVVSLAIFRIHAMHLPTDYSFLALIFFATISGYNFVKYAGIAKLYHRRLTRQLKVIQIFSGISFIAMSYFIFQLKLESIFILLVLSIMNFFYAFPIFTNGKNLRNLSGLKIFVIAFVWSTTCVILPTVEYASVVSVEVVFHFVQNLLMIVALMVPFEIRDYRFDDKSLQTLPQLFGVFKTKILGMLLLLLVLILGFATNSINIYYTLIFVSCLIPLILFAKINQPKYYASFWVEALPIIALLIYLTKI